MKLRLADDLSLPLDAATQTFLVLGKRGSGKSNTAVRFAEQLFAAGIPFVTIDPVDNWWGLKSSFDGKAPGLPVYVFGGKKADAPLEPTGGRLMADVIVESGISAVLSIKHFELEERAAFVAEFAHRLFAINSSPRHVFLEEAHVVAPQEKLHGDKVMLNRVLNLITLGRSSGIGVSCITQRPAQIHKTATTQSEVLVVHRTIGPHDVSAVSDWIKHHRVEGNVLGEIGGLRAGEAFFWAPAFPDDAPLGLRKVHVLRRETFDSGATPKVGEKPREARAHAALDLDAIGEKMRATIERAKADDPKELRKKIAGLERELATERKKPAPAAKVERVEVPMLSKEDRLALVMSARELGRGRDDLLARIEGLLTVRPEPKREVAPPARSARTTAPPAPAPRASRVAPAEPTEGLTGPEQRILDAIAWLESCGIDEPEQAAVAWLAGYSNAANGAFRNPRGRLNGLGYIAYLPAECIRLTDAGRALARAPEAPGTSEELQRRILERLPGPERKILELLIAAYPDSVDGDELARGAGYSDANNGAFRNPRGRLRTLGLVDYPSSGRVAARPLLFLS